MKYLSGLGTIPWPIMGSMAVCRELKSGGNITTLSPAIVQLPVRFVREPRTRQCMPGLKHNVAELIGLVVGHGMELRPVVSRIITRTGRVTERAKGRFEVHRPLREPAPAKGWWGVARMKPGARRRQQRVGYDFTPVGAAAAACSYGSPRTRGAGGGPPASPPRRGVHRRCLPHCWQADSPGC